MLWWIAQGWPGQFGQLLRPLAGAKLPIWIDLLAFCQFFTIGRDIFIRTILWLSCEALFPNQAAKLGDLSLVACQVMLPRRLSARLLAGITNLCRPLSSGVQTIFAV